MSERRPFSVTTAADHLGCSPSHVRNLCARGALRHFRIGRLIRIPASERSIETPPKRIQRRRVKGWRMPEGAVYVGRGSWWGNPYRIGTVLIPDALAAVEAFRANLPISLDLSSLRGRDLVCWCPLNQPCHADVLLEIANVDLRRAAGALE